jgi:hypothetical protein
MTLEEQKMEECRAAFEESMTDGYDFTRDKDGMYVKPDTFEAYEGWQAAWNARTESGLVNAQEIALNPRRWTQEMNDAWHKSIPDTHAAFAALRHAALAIAKPTGQQQALEMKPDAHAFSYDGTPLPYASLQWKGTDACFDFHCKCVAFCHFDGYFAYYVKCPHCSTIYQMPFNLFPREAQDVPADHCEPVLLEADEGMELATDNSKNQKPKAGAV